MISKFTLKFGRTPGAPAAEIDVEPTTVFVGPNNSGKSRILAEILAFCSSGQASVSNQILDTLAFAGLRTQEIASAISQVAIEPGLGEFLHPGSILIGNRGQRFQAHLETLEQTLGDPASNREYFCQTFLRLQTLMLDGRSRINLVNEQAAGDLQQMPQSSFQQLFGDNSRREEVRRIIFEAFREYFVIDPTKLGQLRIRLSSRAPSSDLEERGIHEDAVRFHAAARSIDEASDGVKAFSGIITEVMAGDPRVVLIDEPEAFLHPPLAYKLGMELSRAGRSSGKRLFVSTHSSEFLMGCIQSGAPLNIVRLTYRHPTATARVLASADILALMRKPLLRSTGVLSGLFYEFVVVTESDTDRAFYQEINNRLLEYRPDWGIPNCLFINAQNKQTIPTIVKPLRHLGIPTAGIVDIDVLKDGGVVWKDFLAGVSVPALAHDALAMMRASVHEAMKRTGKDMKRDGGLAILAGGDHEACGNLLEQLREYGLFVVPGGELESWLRHLGATGHGPAWLVSIFQMMGEDPDESTFVKPSAGDVWGFLGQIKKWLVDTARKGIPD